MNEQPEILSFVKAMASADRLRIVGLLSQGSKRAAEIAEALGMHPSDVNRHLEQLTDSSVVSEADGVYDLNEKAIESLARGQFEGKRPVYVPEEDSEEDVRKVLKAYLNVDGECRTAWTPGCPTLYISRASKFMMKQNVSGFERPCFHQFKVGFFNVFKHRFSGSKNDRGYQDQIFIN